RGHRPEDRRGARDRARHPLRARPARPPRPARDRGVPLGVRVQPATRRARGARRVGCLPGARSSRGGPGGRAVTATRVLDDRYASRVGGTVDIRERVDPVVWGTARGPLDDRAVEAYAADGFLALPGLLDAETVQ